jgi:hypothetical protein
MTVLCAPALLYFSDKRKITVYCTQPSTRRLTLNLIISKQKYYCCECSSVLFSTGRRFKVVLLKLFDCRMSLVNWSWTLLEYRHAVSNDGSPDRASQRGYPQYFLFLHRCSDLLNSRNSSYLSIWIQEMIICLPDLFVERSLREAVVARLNVENAAGGARSFLSRREQRRLKLWKVWAYEMPQ